MLVILHLSIVLVFQERKRIISNRDCWKRWNLMGQCFQ
ncbi:unnamed protein product [Brassica rapa]|uniref:Uncharacterized protein n=1 Tax=Brassica campestris TaxID=3711 RepID=A0A8D9FZC4_BRACM|nr:unnamed protein product [Brassica rapa]